MSNRSRLFLFTLARAADEAGGTEALSRRLHVPRWLLALYLGGRHEIPEEIFLRAIDVLMAERPGPAAKLRAGPADPP